MIKKGRRLNVTHRFSQLGFQVGVVALELRQYTLDHLTAAIDGGAAKERLDALVRVSNAHAVKKD